MDESIDIMRRIPPDPIDRAPTHEDESEFAEKLKRLEDVGQLLRYLEARKTSLWRRDGRLVEIRFRPEILAAIRRRAAELIHAAGGSYRDRGCVIRSDGSRIWTELG